MTSLQDSILKESELFSYLIDRERTILKLQSHLATANNLSNHIPSYGNHGNIHSNYGNNGGNYNAEWYPSHMTQVGLHPLHSQYSYTYNTLTISIHPQLLFLQDLATSRAFLHQFYSYFKFYTLTYHATIPALGYLTSKCLLNVVFHN